VFLERNIRRIDDFYYRNSKRGTLRLKITKRGFSSSATENNIYNPAFAGSPASPAEAPPRSARALAAAQGRRQASFIQAFLLCSAGFGCRSLLENLKASKALKPKAFLV